VGLLSQQPGNPSDRQLAKIMVLDEKTIRRGRRELENEQFELPQERQRREGGGRPRAEKKTRN
jgi:DNA-binding transcriptional regulator YhcF (GntR family)